MTSMCLSVVQEPSRNWKTPWPWEDDEFALPGLSPILWRSPGTWVWLGASALTINHELCQVVRSYISMPNMRGLPR